MAMRSLASFLLLGIFISGSVEAIRKKSSAHSWRWTPRLHATDLCRDRVHAVTWCNTSVHIGPTGDILLDADWGMKRSGYNFSKLKVNITKCTEAVSYNNCEYFQTWTWTVKVCDMLTSKGFPWTNFISSIQPPFACTRPMIEGNYSAHDAILEMDMISELPVRLDGVVWRVVVEIFDGTPPELYACWKFTCDIFKRRIRT